MDGKLQIQMNDAVGGGEALMKYYVNHPNVTRHILQYLKHHRPAIFHFSELDIIVVTIQLGSNYDSNMLYKCQVPTDLCRTEHVNTGNTPKNTRGWTL